MKRSSYALMLFLLLVCVTAMAAVDARLDRTRVYEGDSFTLIISTDQAGTGEPNLSVLEKNFHILGTGSSQSVSVVNGVRSEKHSWNVTLQPKKSGTLHIPSIRVGRELTNPVQLEVTPPPEISSAQGGQPVFIESEINNAEQPHYLQQQVLYTVRLFFNRPVLEGALTDPAVDNAIVERLGNDSRYTVSRDGKDYTVIERRYAIFPEKSGALEIPPVKFSGRLATPAAQRQRPGMNRPGISPGMRQFFGGDPFADFDSLFDRGQPVMLQGKSHSLDVLPRPDGYTGKHWLPASKLELEDSWTSQPPELKVGEPVTRTLTIRARGLLDTLLPQLKAGEVSGLRLYPETPVSETRTDGSEVYASSRLTLSYMPTQEGKLKIPEIDLKWWDTGAAVERTAELPGWELNVLPGVLPATATEPSDATGTSDQMPESSTDGIDSANDMGIALPGVNDGWMKSMLQKWYIPLAVLVLLALAAIVIMRRRRGAVMPQPEARQPDTQQAKNETARHKPVQPDTKSLQQGLRDACAANDKKSAADALLQLAAASRPDNPPATLPALASMLAQGAEEVLQLDRSIYAASGDSWDGENFYRVFENGLVFIENEQEKSAGLSGLYPDYQ